MAIRRLTASVASAGTSIASASAVRPGLHTSTAAAHASVATRCQIVSDDSTSVRDRPR
jgi:hypothetical protein